MGIEVWHISDSLHGFSQVEETDDQYRHLQEKMRRGYHHHREHYMDSAQYSEEENGAGGEDEEVLEVEVEQIEFEARGEEEESLGELDSTTTLRHGEDMDLVEVKCMQLYLMPPLPLVAEDDSSNRATASSSNCEPEYPLKYNSTFAQCLNTTDSINSTNSATSKTSVLKKVFDLLKSFTPGSDLTRFQVPVQLNMPKSQLQMYGESVYCCRNDLLGECARGTTALQRFLNVVAWHISTTRLAPFSQAPFNPILGETHHVSSGNLNVILEQVSHHPPITALYATNEVDNLRLQWWHNACPRFYGNKVEVAIHGKRNLWLDSHEESYEMTSPKLCIRLFPVPGNEWVGNTSVKCNSSGYEATLTFKAKPFLGLRGSLGQVVGHIWDRPKNRLLFELNGHWNKVVMIKDVKTNKTSVLFDAQDSLTKLKAPILKDIKEVAKTESLMVWRHVMAGLMKKDWELARKAKNEIEDKQREQGRLRNKSRQVWTPKYFELKDNEWQWCHSFGSVSRAPLLIPST